MAIFFGVFIKHLLSEINVIAVRTEASASGTETKAAPLRRNPASFKNSRLEVPEVLFCTDYSPDIEERIYL